MKRCAKCGETKLLTEFHRNRAKKDGYQYTCKVCCAMWFRAKKDYRRLQRYGLTPDMYDLYLALQENACALCRRPFTKRPNIDHCHDTGKVRGLLCSGCNTGLGRFGDDPERLRAAADYVERYS